jgi:predicted dehydrogenase
MSEILSRRTLFERARVAAAGLGLGAMSPRSTWARPAGANDAVRVAIVGLRKRGKEHIETFLKLPGVRITALCDCDTQFLDAERAKFQDRRQKVATYVDYRKMLEDNNVDAVVVVTPDHWHALMTVWACQAGKDVYVEKPASHNIREGRRMIRAARKYGRIVQVGSQNRSDVGLRRAVPYIHEGNLGRIIRTYGIHCGERRSIGKANGPQPIPATADYDLFQGPADLVPLARRNLHYDWHWFWDTGTGEMGNIGGHQIDHNRWALGEKAVAPNVICFGGRFGYDDDGETPNTQFALFDYRPAPLIYEIRGIPRVKDARKFDRYRGRRASLCIECENGYFAGGRGGGWVYDNEGKRVKEFHGDSGRTHQDNFIAAVRSRNTADLHAPLTEGHVSATMCHMANISFRLGRRESPGAIRKAIEGNDVLEEFFDRLVRHLRANGVDLDRTQLVLGPRLTFDAQAEQFTGESADLANLFLTRNYREPFVIPEIG